MRFFPSPPSRCFALELLTETSHTFTLLSPSVCSPTPQGQVLTHNFRSCRIPNSIVTPYTRFTVSSHSLFTHSTLGLPPIHYTTLIQRRHTVEQGSRQYFTIPTIPSHTSQAESKNNLDHISTPFNHSSILSTSHLRLSSRRVKYSRKLTQIS
ncbi:hypothetical protein LY76DRAFT_419093 [Colletotrichum caudatum]|nr:hypothetical protein LY76DRAFT_419093 [Colletotrichum caudatum]